jgi:hypothetical protein
VNARARDRDPAAIGLRVVDARKSHDDTPCVDAWPSAIDLSVGIAGIAGALVWNGAYGTSAWYAAIPGALALEGAYCAIKDVRCRHRDREAVPHPSAAPVSTRRA